MKNSILFLIFSLIFILPLCSSAQIEMKSSYDSGETLMAKVSGNFLQPISEENILFYRRHMPTNLDVSLMKIDNDYYIYAQIPSEKISDNYSMVLQGVKYLQGTQIKEENLFYNFSITNKTADFSIDPAALIANSDFSIFVQNIQDKEISLKVYFSNKTSSSGGFFSFFAGEESKEIYSFSLDSGETKGINFKLEDLGEGLNTIKIKSDNLEYLIPAYITKEKEKPKFSFEKSLINISLITNSSESRNISIYNSGEELIKNISLSLSPSLKSHANLSTYFIKELKANSSTEIVATFFSDEEFYIEGFIKAEQEDKVRFLTIYLNSMDGYSPLGGNKSNATNFSQTCSEQNGTPCGSGFNCSGKFVEASDDICCVGKCSNPNSSLTKKIIGWSLLIISLVILFWFLTVKYFGTKNKIDFSSNFRKR